MSIVKTHGSLFSGIGGFDLAADWVGWQNVFQVEKDPFCTAVLNKNFPNVKRYGDIKQVDFRPYRDTIYCLSGGFPCQPFSHAGKQRGLDDDRYLWPEYERAIAEIKPRWVVGENVTGIKNLALDLVCSSLESQGYAVRPVIIPASAVGAWHRRERIWIIANASAQRLQNGNCNTLDEAQREQKFKRFHCNEMPSEYSIESAVYRNRNGLPGRVDRIKSLGNAIVPQVATEIFKIINEIE